ncbi:hypothetical protein BKA70DRAFT_1425452 [Coprinopsis sp. MPI-PUGE-AT-0042]|nr:hypothetical protein BKA70DRAFT_1425452 [Coprinopsis sp. MPI-PUGE-AT-0042]
MSPSLDAPAPRGTQSKALYTPSTNAIDSFILLLGKRRPRFDLPNAADTLCVWNKWTHYGTKFYQLDGHEMQQNVRSVALDVSLYHQHVNQCVPARQPFEAAIGCLAFRRPGLLDAEAIQPLHLILSFYLYLPWLWPVC